MRADELDLALRIVMEDPLPGVAIALFCGTSGSGQLIGPVHASSAALTFDFDVAVKGSVADGRPRLLGPFVQGPPAARFVYLNIGSSAGQFGSHWARRTKVPLGELNWSMIDALAPGWRLAAHIGGRARDGGPACASVPLLPPGWRIAA